MRNYSTLLQSGNWQQTSALLLPSAVHQWLSLSTSLTEQLRLAFGSISVEVLSEFWIEELTNGERDFFPFVQEKVWCREVILKKQENALIFARTLMSPALLENYPELQHLGNRALGEWLFSHPKRIKQKQQWLQDEITGLYARRTLMALEKNARPDHILVAELFLEPSIFMREIQ